MCGQVCKDAVSTQLRMPESRTNATTLPDPYCAASKGSSMSQTVCRMPKLWSLLKETSSNTHMANCSCEIWSFHDIYLWSSTQRCKKEYWSVHGRMRIAECLKRRGCTQCQMPTGILIETDCTATQEYQHPLYYKRYPCPLQSLGGQHIKISISMKAPKTAPSFEYTHGKRTMIGGNCTVGAIRFPHQIANTSENNIKQPNACK